MKHVCTEPAETTPLYGGGVPVPASVALGAPSAATVLVTFRLAPSAVSRDGLNVTSTVQLPPATSVWPVQVSLAVAKSAASDPATEIASGRLVAVPSFETTKLNGVLALSLRTSPKS